MDDRSLEALLAEHAREEDEAMDPRLERLALGTLSAEEQAALTRDAEADPELAAQVALFQPLSEATLGRVVEAIEAPRAPARPARAWLRVVPALALAAAALIAVAISGEDPLPGYTVEVRAGDRVVRGDGPKPDEVVRRLRADSRLSLTLTPASPVDGPVVAKAYVHDDGGYRVAPGRPEVAEGGAVRLEGPAASLLGVRSGTVAVRLVVARPDGLPTPTAAFDASEGTAHAEVRLLLQPAP